MGEAVGRPGRGAGGVSRGVSVGEAAGKFRGAERSFTVGTVGGCTGKRTRDFDYGHKDFTSPEVRHYLKTWVRQKEGLTAFPERYEVGSIRRLKAKQGMVELEFRNVAYKGKELGDVRKVFPTHSVRGVGLSTREGVKIVIVIGQ